MKRFHSGRDKRPPEAFAIDYTVEVMEKVEVPAEPDSLAVPGTVEVKERGTGVFEPREAVFHAKHCAIPAGLIMGASEPGPAQAQSIRKVLEIAVVEQDELIALFADETANIQLYVLIETFQWLIELSSERPTSRPGG